MKGLKRSLANAKTAVQNITIPVNQKTISVTNGAPGYGNVTVCGLPQGNILFLGCVSYLTFSTTDADVIATFDGDYAIGTAGTVDGDFGDAGEAVFIPSTALGAATAGVSPSVRGVSTDALGGGILDNTAGDQNVVINLLIDDASISGAADFTANGYIMMCFAVMGDD